jgi:adenylosuccinate lyase
MKTWQERKPFLQYLKADPDVTRHLSETELEEICNVEKSVRNVDAIFARCGL